MRSSNVFWPLLSIIFISLLILTITKDPPKTSQSDLDIAIVTVITNTTSRNDYDVALKSVECYAKVQNYAFRVLVDSDFADVCRQRHKFFLRHCIIGHVLPRHDVVLFVDADHGVVNPKRRIEEFLTDPKWDVTFYDRFFDWEVMAGTYIVRNSQFSIDFLNYWANFESKMPRVKHGSDNSALHLVLAETLFSGSHPEKVELCREAYYKAANTFEIGTYIACVRDIFGAREDFGKVRIVRKGGGWSRDDWLTSGMWSPERDFMLHGWKTRNLREPPNSSASPLEPIPMNYAHWFNPLGGPIVLEKCVLGNDTWTYNPRLLADRREIDRRLNGMEGRIERERAKAIGRLYTILEKN